MNNENEHDPVFTGKLPENNGNHFYEMFLQENSLSKMNKFERRKNDKRGHTNLSYLNCIRVACILTKIATFSTIISITINKTYIYGLMT